MWGWGGSVPAKIAGFAHCGDLLPDARHPSGGAVPWTPQIDVPAPPTQQLQTCAFAPAMDAATRWIGAPGCGGATQPVAQYRGCGQAQPGAACSGVQPNPGCHYAGAGDGGCARIAGQPSVHPGRVDGLGHGQGRACQTRARACRQHPCRRPGPRGRGRFCSPRGALSGATKADGCQTGCLARADSAELVDGPRGPASAGPAGCGDGPDAGCA